MAAVIIFAVMLHAEKNLLTAYEKGSIYVAKHQIPEGVVINEKNLNTYLDLKELDKSVIPDAALKVPEEVLNLVSRYNIDKGTLLTMSMFESINQIIKDMEEPVIAGFKVDDLYQLVGGTLRTGDRIHIYNVNEEGVAEPVWNDVYVQQVFDNTGVTIPSENIEDAVQRVNVYMDKKDIETFYSNLSAGTLRVVKVCD